MEGLQVNTSLRYLSISANNALQDTAESIAAMLRANKTLLSLNLGTRA